MMLIARVFRDGPGWSAHCDPVGVYTQGPTRRDAIANLAEAIELQANRDGMKIQINDLGDGSLFITANEPALLAAEVLRHQREISHLSLNDVAKKLGASSVSTYAAYERGKREPSLSKMLELLAIVAPGMALTLGPRAPAKPARRPTSSPAKKSAS